jgi:hypothetical protein
MRRASIRSGLAVLVASLAASAAVAAGPVATSGGTAGASVGTALPPGWELCVLQGLTAPATPQNVANLDEWQAAEGGSTNNTAAYNPFNTGRTTDLSNNPLPETASANGFPAFVNWFAGCVATDATLMQPNMWSITAALRAGTVAPPQAFLATVDQSQWCAPSADGVPCYTGQILGAAGDLASLLSHSSALTVFGNVQTDVQKYQLASIAVAVDQKALVGRAADLAGAQSALTAARGTLTGSEATLRKFAIEEYVNSGLYESSSVLNQPSLGLAPFAGPQNADGVVAHEYAQVVASNLLGQLQIAQSGVRASLAQRKLAQAGVDKAVLILARDDATESQAVTKLGTDVAALQQAGACTTVTLTVIPVAAPPDVASPVAAATPAPASTTTTTTLPPTTTTTTTTLPPTTTTTTTADTTTTTADATTTTQPGSVPAVATPTTTPPPTTTTTNPPAAAIAPEPTTTTTTTVPAVPAAPANGTLAEDPAGLSLLQGCMSSITPTAA